VSLDPATVWITIAGMAAITFGLRASFLLLPERVPIPPLLRRSLRFVPAAVLTAIWAPELFLSQGALHLSPDNARLLAGLVAIAVAWRWNQVYATILAGLVSLHLFGWLARELATAGPF